MMSSNSLRGGAIAVLITAGTALPAHAESFRVMSSDIGDGDDVPAQHVYQGMGCAGGNLSPALSWEGAPEGTRSFAVTAYDPDAPTASGWWHWVVFNIPATVTALPTGAGAPDSEALPDAAVQSRTDFGTTGYGGPCPSPGDDPHRYRFTVHALDVEQLDLDEQATPGMVSFQINAHSLASDSITAEYRRPAPATAEAP